MQVRRVRDSTIAYRRGLSSTGLAVRLAVIQAAEPCPAIRPWGDLRPGVGLRLGFLPLLRPTGAGRYRTLPDFDKGKPPAPRARAVAICLRAQREAPLPTAVEARYIVFLDVVKHVLPCSFTILFLLTIQSKNPKMGASDGGPLLHRSQFRYRRSNPGGWSCPLRGAWEPSGGTDRWRGYGGGKRPITETIWVALIVDRSSAHGTAPNDSSRPGDKSSRAVNQVLQSTFLITSGRTAGEWPCSRANDRGWSAGARRRTIAR